MENEKLEQKDGAGCGNKCGMCHGHGGMCSGHGGRHGFWLVKILIFVFIVFLAFWSGVKIGELKVYLGEYVRDSGFYDYNLSRDYHGGGMMDKGREVVNGQSTPIPASK